MTKWLTTGEMIDRLRVGEVAVCESGKLFAEQNSHEIEFYLKVESFGTTEKRRYRSAFDNFVLSKKWRILPKYVSFEEAMKALWNKETVRYEIDEPNELFEYKIINGQFFYRNLLRGDEKFIFASRLGGVGIRGVAITEGRWTIVGDSND